MNAGAVSTDSAALGAEEGFDGTDVGLDGTVGRGDGLKVGSVVGCMDNCTDVGAKEDGFMVGKKCMALFA